METVARDASDLLHGNEIEIVDSALYKALHRLEDAGAIAAE